MFPAQKIYGDPPLDYHLACGAAREQHRIKRAARCRGLAR